MDTADRTLTAMGIEYVADPNHMNTLRELAKKLPTFLRAKWTECTRKIIDSRHSPKFQDYAKSIKVRVKLVDNDFRQDMNSVFARETNMWKKGVNSDGTSPQLETFPTGHGLNSRGQSGILNAQIVCFICSGNTRFGSVNFLQAYTMRRKGRLCNEVDLVTSL